jgi:hypothetical protein
MITAQEASDFAIEHIGITFEFQEIEGKIRKASYLGQFSVVATIKDFRFKILLKKQGFKVVEYRASIEPLNYIISWE